MPNDALTFAIAADAPAELALAARGLAEGVTGAGRACEVLIDPWAETLAGRSRVVEVGETDHAAGRWRLELGARDELELFDPAGASVTLPFVLPSLPPGVRARRILFVGGEAGRRTRMMAKTFDALRRRGGSPVAIWRGLPDELLRQRFAGEVHCDVRGPELARLLAFAAALVEVSDEATPEGMLLAAIGRASGIPTVLHVAVPAAEWGGRVAVREWSGEAFAEAALEAARQPRDPALGAHLRRDAGARLAAALP